jgi:hypothetical protein
MAPPVPFPSSSKGMELGIEFEAVYLEIALH